VLVTSSHGYARCVAAAGLRRFGAGVVWLLSGPSSRVWGAATTGAGFAATGTT